MDTEDSVLRPAYTDDDDDNDKMINREQCVTLGLSMGCTLLEDEDEQRTTTLNKVSRR